MASIKQRKSSFSVIYWYLDSAGERKQKWDTLETRKEAKQRKAFIEYYQEKFGYVIVPLEEQFAHQIENSKKELDVVDKDITLRDFLEIFVNLYGTSKWSPSTFSGKVGSIENYINPIIGDMEVQDITTRVVDKYIQTLQKTPSVSRKNRKARTEFVTNSTIEKIIKLLRCAFKQAVRWELIEKNPFDNVVLPKTEYKKRDIWDAETIRLALDQCTDSKLYIAMNLAFACSLRMGEILGLTWKNVHIEDENIATDNAYIYIEAELARASKQAIETLGEKDIYHIFTPLMPNTSTRIILKKPKTDSSIRKVWLPKTVAY